MSADFLICYLLFAICYFLSASSQRRQQALSEEVSAQILEKVTNRERLVLLNSCFRSIEWLFDSLPPDD